VLKTYYKILQKFSLVLLLVVASISSNDLLLIPILVICVGMIILALISIVVGAIFGDNSSSSNSSQTQYGRDYGQDYVRSEERRKDFQEKKLQRDLNRGTTDCWNTERNGFGAAYHKNNDGSRTYKDGDGRPWWW